MFSASEIQADIERWLGETDYGQEPAGLYEPIRYAMSLGGKRIRPFLTLAACALFKDDYVQARTAATAIEVFHNFTLLHDDVMDKATLRRGKATVVARNGVNTAILSGDAMLIEAYTMLQKTDTPSFALVMDAFNKMALEVCEGQQMDMDFELRTDVSSEEYLEMIRLKTAVLIATSIKVGALIGGGTAGEVQELYDYGTLLGLAFQLQDDLLDSFGDEATFGKAIGGDIMSNKKTYLLINAYEMGDSQQKKELAHWVTSYDAVREEKIASVKALYEATGARQKTEDKIGQLFKQAQAKLTGMEMAADGKRFFLDFTAKMFMRDK